MSRLASRLRIGEKIGLGFGLVILIFLGVIVHEQLELARLSADYERLHALYGARQSYAFGIERRLGAMRAAQSEFLVTRNLDAVAQVARAAVALDAEAAGLARLDAPSQHAATEIRTLIADYLGSFEAVVEAWRINGLDEKSGLQGAFRRTAHELEALAGSSAGSGEEVTGLEIAILQLRRREKDYLLRGDASYVAIVNDILTETAERVARAPIGEPEREALTERLAAYRRDFNALVEQDRRIEGLEEAMGIAAGRITPLVEENLEEASRLMTSMTDAIAEQAAARARINLLIAFGATLLGAAFAVMITSRIVRPVRKIAGLLDRMITETPRERIPTVPGARDEIDAMAASLNVLADHKSTFVNWWRSAMREAVALRDLHAAGETSDRSPALAELRMAVDARLECILAVCAGLERNSAIVQDLVASLPQSGATLSSGDVKRLKEAAAGVSVVSQILQAESGHSADRREDAAPGAV
ncbi:methyl-accepting chemotaxis protein [Thiocapsa marina]|uniref:Histidine kinase HAMP region domain protein n=1 Tax=Thiocapsa marina 5811 TaxID=768671 RepID=F9U7V4_9GAMM|nr:HAMP domain-containing protein [Thiocapsa marina]EGV19734.1 histidine kinase HAMP region domain protein [Thiocapsa marina 5811]